MAPNDVTPFCVDAGSGLANQGTCVACQMGADGDGGVSDCTDAAGFVNCQALGPAANICPAAAPVCCGTGRCVASDGDGSDGEDACA